MKILVRYRDFDVTWLKECR